MAKMIRVFETSAQAEVFAKTVKGKVEVKYDWDILRKVMIKEYVVKF